MPKRIDQLEADIRKHFDYPSGPLTPEVLRKFKLQEANRVAKAGTLPQASSEQIKRDIARLDREGLKIR